MTSKIGSKLRTGSRLAKELQRFRRKNPKAKIVFTNGCFDLIHRGHVEYLESARKQGDVLVVALNSDQSVRKLKGKSRPINSLPDRMRVIAALESVDWVTSFGDSTPLRLILNLKPELIVKGGDWKPSQIVGSSEARSWGGKTRSLKFLEGRSTTRILEKAAK